MSINVNASTLVLLCVILVQSDLERHHAQKLCNPQCFRATMAGRGAGRNVLKTQLKDLQDRVGAVEGRLDRAETTLEFSEAYRRVRIEHSPGLTDLWTRIDSREIPGNRIKEEASKIIDDEVKAQLSKQVVEDQAQAKSQGWCRSPSDNTLMGSVYHGTHGDTSRNPNVYGQRLQGQGQRKGEG